MNERNQPPPRSEKRCDAQVFARHLELIYGCEKSSDPVRNQREIEGLAARLDVLLYDEAAARDLFFIARFADYFDDTDLALAALRRMYVDLNSLSTGLLFAPTKNKLHKDPRFKAILVEIGLVDYWRQSGNWADVCKPVGADDFACE